MALSHRSTGLSSACCLQLAACGRTPGSGGARSSMSAPCPGPVGPERFSSPQLSRMASIILMLASVALIANTASPAMLQ